MGINYILENIDIKPISNPKEEISKGDVVPREISRANTVSLQDEHFPISPTPPPSSSVIPSVATLFSSIPSAEQTSETTEENKEEKALNIHNTSDNVLEDSHLEHLTSLQDLKKYLVNDYKICPLKETAINTVLGDGNEEANIMLIGEAPGAEEDETGLPFVGRSGKLLMKALESIQLYRDKNIYISNTVFWRPPGNRDPHKHEVNMCYPILKKVIQLVNPKIIILVGRVAANNVLRLEQERNISDLMKKWINLAIDKNNNILIKVVYHPAYLLRSPSQKKVLWEDLIEIKNKIKELDIKI